MVHPLFRDNYEDPVWQDTVADLIDEIIGISGVDCTYLPRSAVKADSTFGEDTISEFRGGLSLVVYPKTVSEWGGEGDIITKLGISIPDRMVVTLSQRLWSQQRLARLYAEEGGAILLESGDSESLGETGTLLLESSSANGAFLTAEVEARPMEGDLIWMPIPQKLMVIRFVEHEEIFYQFGKLMTYDLTLELFDYASEKLNTGVAAVDAIEAAFSMDILPAALLMEDGGQFLTEDGGVLILDIGDTRPEAHSNFADNTTFDTEADGDIDFTSSHPFQGTRRRY